MRGISGILKSDFLPILSRCYFLTEVPSKFMGIASTTLAESFRVSAAINWIPRCALYTATFTQTMYYSVQSSLQS